MNIVIRAKEIETQIKRAQATYEDKPAPLRCTYENGVIHALQWVLGEHCIPYPKTPKSP